MAKPAAQLTSLALAASFCRAPSQNTIWGAGASDDFCFGYTHGSNWCWLTNDGYEDYATESQYSHHGGCEAFNGHDGNYYCENAMANHKPGGGDMHVGSADSIDGPTGADASWHAAWHGFLQGLVGHSDVDCGKVCETHGTYWKGMKMANSVWTCTCGDGIGEVKVQCVGTPFQKCCAGECEDAQCPSSAVGWSCPAGGGCPGGDCDAPDWKEWVSAHNIFRCMHDVPPVVWDSSVYADAYKTFADEPYMVHSECYDVPAPAGPAGENLFQSSSSSFNSMDAVSAWYSEVKDCGPMPGCEKHSTGVVGHFTAMIWQGAKSIGCMSNHHHLKACRYKAQDFLSCNTPNFGGDPSFVKNVYPRVKSFAQCKAEVQSCGLPVFGGRDGLDAITGLAASAGGIPGFHLASMSVGLPLMAVVGASLVGLLVFKLRRHQPQDSSPAALSLTSGDTDLELE